MTSWIQKGKRSAAAELAPVIRALKSSDYSVRVSFSEEEIPQKSDQKSIILDGTSFDSIESIYIKLKSCLDQTPVPFTLNVTGLGRFDVKSVSTEQQEKRMGGRICLVTGAAQGFGEGIARELAEAGATVVVADINEPLARSVSESLNEQYGPGTAWSVRVDVGDECSVSKMVEETVLTFGGLDVLVSNAGILRAGGLDDITLEVFELVTRINYTAFFLVTKYGSRPMKLESRFNPDYTADIIQINSKSGLEGSNRNFAYAGSKFGGIGLVQSFAKELVTDRIKVNAICPGNYYEGPLWSDPQKGLFVQYLKAGKVPGAKSVEDVYRYYVEKVPMRRGCSPLDVTRAIFYCIEQSYETGQAIPVTGGQNMLK